MFVVFSAATLKFPFPAPWPDTRNFSSFLRWCRWCLVHPLTSHATTPSCARKTRTSETLGEFVRSLSRFRREPNFYTLPRSSSVYGRIEPRACPVEGLRVYARTKHVKPYETVKYERWIFTERLSDHRWPDRTFFTGPILRPILVVLSSILVFSVSLHWKIHRVTCLFSIPVVIWVDTQPV